MLVASGVPDHTATEHRYLPAGWATFECASKDERPAVADDEDTGLRLPYARKMTPGLPHFIRDDISPWLGRAAHALGPAASVKQDVNEAFFQYPPAHWQASPLRPSFSAGHQVALKLRGEPLCTDDVAARLPCKDSLDFAAMHTDAVDAGCGTIVYLNHAAIPSSACVDSMRYADLIVAGGRDGGPLIRIQTFSPQHFVVVNMDFRNCAHGNVAPLEDSKRPVKGVSQLRVLHYSRSEIVRVCQFYRDSPSRSMRGDGRDVYLDLERSSLDLP
eukprot:6191556-Pleurochrysis_carterae.AAC.1